MSNYIDLRELADKYDAELRAAEEEPGSADWELVENVEALAGQLGEDVRSYGDRIDPTLIPEDEFEDYARELAEDIGAMPEGNDWPAYCIDWKRAARELAVDYMLVTYAGRDYYVRA